MNKTYILIRVSSDKQDFDSQLQGITNYCRDNNIELLEEHIIKEFNVSGYKTEVQNREGLNKILALAKEQLIDTLIIFNLDRIGRRTDLLPFITKMTLAGVKIISVTEGIINQGSDVDELMNFIKLWSAQGESRKTSARCRSGKLKTSKDGGFNGGKINLGYKVEDGRLIVDENIAPIIRQAYITYINEGTQATIKYLKKFGIEKNNQTLTQMLRNSIYKGVYAHNKDLYSEEDFAEITQYREELAIVSQEVWELARQRANERRTSQGARCKALNRSDCIYEGILVHGCGNSLTIDWDTRKKPKRMFFRCKHCKKYHIKNLSQSYTANKLLPILDNEIDKLFKELNGEKLRAIYLDSKGDKLNSLINYSKSIDTSLKTQYTTLENANKKLRLMIAQDMDLNSIKIVTDLIEEIKNDIKELEIKKSNIAVDITIEQNAKDKSDVMIEKILNVKDRYYEANNKQKKQILQLIIDKIVVYSYTDIQIFLNL